MEWLKPKQEDVMVPCRKCGNKVTASSLKLDFDEKKMICPDCIKNKSIHKEIEKEVFHKPEQRHAEAETDAKISHKCSSCGYKFKIDPETKKPKNCPYCNARVLSF